MECYEKSPFATRDQGLLLRAVLLEGADVVDAWKEWESVVDLEGHLDNGTFHGGKGATLPARGDR